MEPRIHHFPGGWSVSDGNFATFAGTRDEALRRFETSVLASRACRAGDCDDDASVMLEGVALCMTHYNNFTSRAGATDAEDRLPQESRWEEPALDSRQQAASR